MAIPEKIPNETTRKALAEKDLVTFETTEELFEDLGIHTRYIPMLLNENEKKRIAPEGMPNHGGLENAD